MDTWHTFTGEAMIMDTCADIYQPFRMTLVWPVIVGCVAFYAVRFIASTIDGGLTRWQAILAGVTALMAAVVTTSIARAWNGTDVYWLAFTVGLAFAALVLAANVIMTILKADNDRQG
jgi:cytochrome bd-type quinol oxidase subunit 2